MRFSNRWTRFAAIPISIASIIDKLEYVRFDLVFICLQIIRSFDY